MVYSVYYVPSEDRCKRLNTKKKHASVAWVGGSTCVQGAVPRQLPQTGLWPFGRAWPGNHPIVQGSAEYTERSQDVTVGSFREKIW